MQQQPTSPLDPKKQTVELRTGLEELFGQDTFVGIRVVRSRLRGDPDFAQATVDALSRNSDDLATLVGRVYGSAASKKFRQLWESQQEGLVAYARAVSQHDQAQKAAARRQLGAFPGQVAQYLHTLTAGGTTVTAVSSRLKTHVDDLIRFKPLFRVPQLAIHLDRGVNDGLKLDRQRQTQPVWSLGPAEQGALMERLSRGAGLEPSDVLGWDLMLHDLQAPGLLGADREFLVSSRLDNLVSVHAGVAALVAAAEAWRTGAVAADAVRIPVLAAFDHEEVGSGSATGAKSPLLEQVLGRSVAVRGGGGEDWARAVAGSFCVSSDMAHAVHPNYSERHDPDNQPLPNGGPVVKINTNQRYATDGTGQALFTAACERAGVPWQYFVANNGIPCGTSIGPLTAAQFGVTTVDVGVPGLSMHSARELVGAADPAHLARALLEVATTG